MKSKTSFPFAIRLRSVGFANPVLNTGGKAPKLGFASEKLKFHLVFRSACTNFAVKKYF